MRRIIQGKEVYYDIEYTYMFKYHWYINDGYLRNGILGYFHRVIMNASDDELIDHKDQNKLNNKRRNLGRATVAINRQNLKRPEGEFIGICQRKTGKYRAYITFNKRRIYLGNYGIKEEAAIAYDIAAILLYGKDAGLNFPESRKEYIKLRKGK